MNSSRVDELDKEKAKARKTIKLPANAKPTSKSNMNPASGGDRADSWYFTHT
ncbi:MAG: hypothetical protein PVF15_08795 [Candidatus Bathyarchaeota archaeon]